MFSLFFLFLLSSSAQAFPCISTGIYGKLNLFFFCLIAFNLVLSIYCCSFNLHTIMLCTCFMLCWYHIVPIWLYKALSLKKYAETYQQVHLTPCCTKTQPSMRWTKCRPWTMFALPHGTRPDMQQDIAGKVCSLDLNKVTLKICQTCWCKQALKL